MLSKLFFYLVVELNVYFCTLLNISKMTFQLFKGLNLEFYTISFLLKFYFFCERNWKFNKNDYREKVELSKLDGD